MVESGHVGLRLRQFRQALGLTQHRLAVELSTQQGSVSDWETGKTALDRGWLRLAADLAGNDREIFRWLEQGGEMPPIRPVVPQDRRTPLDGRLIAWAHRLRLLAEEMEGDPAIEAVEQSLREKLG